MPRWFALAWGLLLLFVSSDAWASDKAVVAVFDIESRAPGVSRESLLALGDYLTTRLTETGRYQVVPREQIKAQLGRQKAKSYDTCYDEACQIEIGKELAAEQVVATRIAKLGKRCLVTMKLFELRSATAGGGATAHAECTEEGLLAALETAVAKLGHSEKPRAAEQAKTPEKPAKERTEADPSKPEARGERSDRSRVGPALPGPGPADPQQARCARYKSHGLGQSADLKGLPVLQQVLQVIEASYFAPERADPRQMLQAGLEEVAACAEGLTLRDEGATLLLEMGGASRSVQVSVVDSPWKLSLNLRGAVDWLGQVTPRKDLDGHAVEIAAVQGVLRTLDEHTALLLPEERSRLRQATAGKFGGVGMSLQAKEGRHEVIGVVPASPASAAGIEPGELLVAVDGRSVEGLELQRLIDVLRGEVGSRVEITLRRGEEERAVRLTRAVIQLPMFTATSLAGGVLHVRIGSLGVGVAAKLEEALRDQRPEGLILDLRGCPGGLLGEGNKVADLFLGERVFVRLKNRKGVQNLSTQRRAPFAPLPVVVLVDGRTASGAEMIAAALMLHDRAPALGQKTFGKGSVQELFDLPNGLALKLTTGQYLLANEEPIQSRGISPDVTLRASEQAPTAEDPPVDLARQLLTGAPTATRPALLERLKKLGAHPALER